MDCIILFLLLTPFMPVHAEMPVNAQLPSVSAILNAPRPQLARPKITLISHGNHVVDGANMKEFISLFEKLGQEQRISFIKADLWPAKAWDELNDEIIYQLFIGTSKKYETQFVEAFPDKGYRKLSPAGVDRACRKGNNNSESKTSCLERWFDVNFPSTRLTNLQVSEYKTLSGQLPSDLKTKLKKAWTSTAMPWLDTVNASELLWILGEAPESNRADLLSRWLKVQQATVETMTPESLKNFLDGLPNDSRSNVLDLWIKAASSRISSMSPAEISSAMAALPEERRAEILKSWIKRNNPD